MTIEITKIYRANGVTGVCFIHNGGTGSRLLGKGVQDVVDALHAALGIVPENGMVHAAIQSRDKMSNTSFHRRCYGAQKFWWLRDSEGDFVDLKEYEVEGSRRGDQHVTIRGEFAPGTYTLGCGPRDHGVRQTVVIG